MRGSVAYLISKRKEENVTRPEGGKWGNRVVVVVLEYRKERRQFLIKTKEINKASKNEVRKGA